ncbi:Phosphoglycolate phosphatase [Halomicronema hongdechloris C2206]|uniref:Phosphoglycolate phosphatase n=1 Tax=Halomicronema hongdechloris C2206 TaxID=1641165 RepID=A0A1Z3HP92_9CYAN|nr:HAD hydrolase-like protein [Halomicronema hongdechloris]ASC71977.1 Phosphoglycolate phosphatase [Halomicronema hongdechloris C2206]
MVATFIFDFDGTIADSLGAIVAITNRLAPRFGYEPKSPAEVADLKDLHTRQLLRQSGLSCCSVLWLLRRVRQDLQREIPHLQPFPEMIEVLTTLHQRGYRLGILTSNTADNVHLFLRLHGLSPLFDFVYTGATLLGKRRPLRQLLRRYQLDPATTVYVGG